MESKTFWNNIGSFEPKFIPVFVFHTSIFLHKNVAAQGANPKQNKFERQNQLPTKAKLF